MNKKFIKSDLYEKIMDNIPVCCVDLVVKRGRSFLLVKRIQEPLKNEWCMLGGRIFFWETLIEAAKRKLREEVNIKKAKSIEFLGIGEGRYKKGIFNKPIHTISIVYLIEVSEKENNVKKEINVIIDKTSSDFKWFDAVQSGFHPYVKKFLKLAGFK